ncbi:Ribonuclease D [Candidatus Liberibacter americanus str. Sao Paulo]|uniref:Ribonuclease D n=2 Tax=Candidatus Liberibacter americanus TaxID=309868 RepID=U6B6M8_9HYPH|nr:ribonuclease D [Candidatus Liberibacter americanus]AHA27397.1 Ribonuclease D [Candidatus Liberibacter americanus str. Sao Paulo]EMS36670.1 ribonuclease D [Candidatus Liberibacter americanus PW_SP]
MSNIRVHNGDIPVECIDMYTDAIAVDTETLGLVPRRDRLCVVQLSPGDGTADIIQISKDQKNAPNLEIMLSDRKREKIFHYGRFDIAVLLNKFGFVVAPVFCTKIASRLVRTYTNYHGLKDNLKEMLGVEISKSKQSSEWDADVLSYEQLEYAASDVIYLHALRKKLIEKLEKLDRMHLANSCFDFIASRAELDLLGWDNIDIFAHS